MSETHAARLTRLYEEWDEDALTATSVATAKMGILDCVGCIVGGSRTETAAIVRQLAREQGVALQALVLGTDLRLAAPLAALANGVAGHVLDYDDMSSTMLAHPSVFLTPAVLALSETHGRSGRQALSAYITGFEVGSHFGRAMIPRHYEAGWHATSSLGVFGAAAAASRLLGLTAQQMLNALAIAASNVAGLRANFGTMTKSLHAGQAAEGGVRAALLSSRGFTANRAIFDAPGGFFSTYGAGAQPRQAPPSLEIDASGIGIKPYACCGAGVSLIDAAIDIRDAHAPRADDIACVEALVAEMATSIMPFRAANGSLQAKYCLEYCAAVALLDGKGGMAQFEDERVLRADVQELVKRVGVRSDKRMAQGAGKFGVELKVRLHDGKVLQTQLELPRGHPRRPVAEEALVAKFLECAGPVLGEARAREAAGRLESFEKVPDVRELTDLLRPPRTRSTRRSIRSSPST